MKLYQLSTRSKPDYIDQSRFLDNRGSKQIGANEAAPRGGRKGGGGEEEGGGCGMVGHCIHCSSP